jgi:hypothetical protein
LADRLLGTEIKKIGYIEWETDDEDESEEEAIEKGQEKA